MRKILTIIILILLIIPLSAQGFFLDEFFEDLFGDGELDSVSTGSTKVINEVKVEANTGGNTADSGEIKQGETKSHVEIKTIINGEEIEPIDIESEANEVKVESEIKAEEGIVQVHREIEIDSEKSVENYEVDLPASPNRGEPVCETCNKEGKGVLKWWSGFVEGLKSLLLGIFNIF